MFRLRLPPISPFSSMNLNVCFILANICSKCLGCMYKKSKAGKVSEICNIIHINGIHMLSGGGFPECVFDNAICRSEVVTFLTMYLCEPFQLFIIKLFKICNIICINVIHMLEVRWQFQNRGSFKTQYAVLSLPPFSRYTSFSFYSIATHVCLNV